MRFLHTADWHLGRLFHNAPLIDDQAYILDQFVDLAKDAKPDVILIAGDIYDRAVPPTDAVKLLDEVLTRLVLELEIPIILIAGNHDSPLRLHFGSRLMNKLSLHVYGMLSQQSQSIFFPDDYGYVHFYAMPYTEPAQVREVYSNNAIVDHETALAAWLERVKKHHPAHARSVVMAHAFVQGGSTTESERKLTIGGAETVPTSLFSEFDYVALGHLHRPQILGEGKIHYPGSLLKYSFSEWDHRKSVNVVEMDGTGKCNIETISLRPKREVCVIEGRLSELVQQPPTTVKRDDFVRVCLLDSGALYDPMGQLRQIFPNTMMLDRPTFINADNRAILPTNPRANDVQALFSDFYSQVMGQALSEAQAAVFAEIVNAMQQAEREAAS